MPTPAPVPLRFHPVLKQTIWGGRRLGSVLDKPIGDASDYAESWEIVDHGDDQSKVMEGALDGNTLNQLVTNHPRWLFGKDAPADASTAPPPQFPLLLKYLDCNRVLSVQVHPDDAFGAQMEVPDRGKTEAWYIVASEPDSLIYAGLKTGVDREMLAAAVESGQTESVLHQFHPEPGDTVFIPAGTVHALGAGLLVAEIQQSSNTTFRLFDWNRVGTDGNPRPLHIASSLEVTDYSTGPIMPRRSDLETEGWQDLVSCDKFLLQTLERGNGPVGGDDQFHILTVPRGTAELQLETQSLSLRQGESLLLPAAAGPGRVVAHQDSTVLQMQLPKT